jgi:hypothetical protein
MTRGYQEFLNGTSETKFHQSEQKFLNATTQKMAECRACGEHFAVLKRNQKYCSDQCRQEGVQKAHQKYQLKKKPGRPIPNYPILNGIIL